MSPASSSTASSDTVPEPTEKRLHKRRDRNAAKHRRGLDRAETRSGRTSEYRGQHKAGLDLDTTSVPLLAKLASEAGRPAPVTSPRPRIRAKRGRGRKRRDARRGIKAGPDRLIREATTLGLKTSRPELEASASPDFDRGMRREEMILATTRRSRTLTVSRKSSRPQGAEKRKQHGSKGSTVFRDPNEDDRVWVLFDWDASGWQNFVSRPRGPGDYARSRAQRPASGGSARREIRRLARLRGARRREWQRPAGPLTPQPPSRRSLTDRTGRAGAFAPRGDA
jgi:hypothetical protein